MSGDYLQSRHMLWVGDFSSPFNFIHIQKWLKPEIEWILVHLFSLTRRAYNILFRVGAYPQVRPPEIIDINKQRSILKVT